VPEALIASIRSKMGRFGRLRLERDGEWLLLVADDARDLDEVVNLKVASDLLGSRAPGGYRISPKKRGELKQVLLAAGRPVQDLAGYDDGDAFEIRLSPTLKDGRPWAMRDYQRAAVEAFHERGAASGGSGVVVLPCGAGKTIVGLGAVAAVGQHTLIICTSDMAVRQWERELIDKTTLAPYEVCELTGKRKELGRSPSRPTSSSRGGRRGRRADAAPAMEKIRAPHVGPRDLRRGAPPAGARVPPGVRGPGHAAPRPHGHARARGRQGHRRLQPDRPQALRRALARLESKGWIAQATAPRSACRCRTDPAPRVRRHAPSARSSAWRARARPSSTCCSRSWPATATTPCS
jgi:hypothetical protein